MPTYESKKDYEKSAPRVYIRTFGCQMNEHDSEKIAGMLMAEGYERAVRAEDADVILLNTCSVRKHAEDRVIGQVNNLKSIKTSRPGVILGLVGCMAENYKEKLFDILPHLDLVCGTNNIYELPGLLKSLAGGTRPADGGRAIAAGRISRPVSNGFPVLREDGFTAWVSIMEGCDNFCSYCIVPHVRGREVSRPPDEILKEIECLIERGFKEITLLGQNVNSYGLNLTPPVDFVTLLEKIDSLKGEKWIRFVTSHPKDATIRLFQAMAKLQSVCEYLHLPLQSGSDRILKVMNRGYTLAEYMKKAEGLRKLVPEVTLATDIIVGFPSETDDDFRSTYNAMKDIEFDSAYVFKYSPRPNTGAEKMEDDVPKRTKEERNRIILELQESISVKKNKLWIGKNVPVLVEGLSRKSRRADKGGPVQSPPHLALSRSGERKKGNSHTFQLCGRARSNKTVVFEGTTELTGKIVEVEISDATANTLKGRVK